MFKNDQKTTIKLVDKRNNYNKIIVKIKKRLKSKNFIIAQINSSILVVGLKKSYNEIISKIINLTWHCFTWVEINKEKKMLNIGKNIIT